jgi:hypothetical protein
MTLAVMQDDKRITSIEGLEQNGVLHRSRPPSSNTMAPVMVSAVDEDYIDIGVAESASEARPDDDDARPFGGRRRSRGYRTAARDRVAPDRSSPFRICRA